MSTPNNPLEPVDVMFDPPTEPIEGPIPTPLNMRPTRAELSEKTLGELRQATANLPDTTPLVIVYDGELVFSPVRRIEASTADVALVGY